MIINKIKSYLIMLKASSYQGKSKFEKVIEMSMLALKLDPKSQIALLMLGDDYSRLKEYEKAKNILNEALKIYPTDEQFSYIMATAIINNGEPIENAIPYLKTYLKNTFTEKGRFPFYMKFFTKILGKKFDWDEYGEELNTYSNSKYQWAQNIVAEFEQKNKS